ncbi:MAG: FAD/NAD(P)-binding protein [Candidatus Portnoybacteria bacterium]|nr:FAD/NAD(P)-binding protein [Candidatus Portnoybacteria bacterium]
MNPYQTIIAEITDIKNESPVMKRFWLGLEEDFEYQPGQIIFLSIPGFGEAAFAPCGPASPAKLGGQADNKKILELCVRKVGKLTGKLHSMRVGGSVGVRGPYGHGWPLNNFQNCHPEPFDETRGKLREGSNRRCDGDSSALPQNDKKKNILIVVGGMGLVPLRTLLLNKEKYLSSGTKIQIFYGARTSDDFLFKENFDQWKKEGIDLQLTIDRACLGWNECVGVVTALFDKHPIVENAAAFLCGPPIMYKFVLQKLQEKNDSGEPSRTISEGDIYMSLERRMHCGIGVCQHCAIGSFYTCKDGPVFRYADIKNIPGAI